jgi:periplasmic divalent cation tolerance protein
MSQPTAYQVTTTIDSRAGAEALAASAVEARLAACAQVSGPITSTYRWQGAVETAEEWIVTFKTAAAAYPALEEHVRGRHPYEVPEILCTSIVDGSRAYLDWLHAETANPAG